MEKQKYIERMIENIKIGKTNNMNEIQLHKTKFEEAKNKLQKFTENESKIGITKIEKENCGIFKRRVTAGELNGTISEIQKLFTKLQSNDNQLFEEFKAVYDALEALDKDYIAAILVNLKNAEEAARQAQDANTTLKEVINSQKNILEKQEKVIGILKSHKEKLDNLQHLENIDELWDLVKTHDNEIKENNEQIREIQKKIEKQELETEKRFSEVQESFTSIEKIIEMVIKKSKLKFIIIISILSTFCALSLVTLFLSIFKVI